MAGARRQRGKVKRRMKMKKRWLLVAMLAHVCASAGLAADPTITVQARQRYPWNGLVDINFTITGTSGTKYDTSFTAKDMVGNTNIAMRTIRKADGTAAAAKEQLLPGTYNWVWDAAADLPKDFKCDRVTVTGTANEFKPLYMVIDLSGGANASSYPVSYLGDVPSGGWGDTYKTTKLVLRRIEPGYFKRLSSYSNMITITLTKPFFIGVFEVTQKQYSSVMGTNPANFNGDKRPVENISYDMIRGSSNGSKWPSSSAVDATSFMGRLRTRTGLNFDLPTSAQWEYACRARTTSDFNNGGNTENDLKKLGRYSGNSGQSGYTANVGSYQSNAWGLYDMHGNVWEWCLDWYGELSNNLTDPLGPSGASPRERILRGGAFAWEVEHCTSSYRMPWGPEWAHQRDSGFRIAITVSK